MTVLGIETATDVCAAAVVRDGKILGESFLQEPRVHAEMLMSQIDEVLRSVDRGIHQIDGIAVSIGPGSFTGLRIGLSVAKGLAWSAEKKLVPVPTLRALARNVVDGGGFDLPISVIPVLDARRDEVYCQLFQADNAGLTPVWAEKAMTTELLMATLGEIDVIVTGEGALKLRNYSEGQSNLRRHFRYPPASITRCSATTIALEGEEELKRGHYSEPATVEPMYIMEFPAKVPFQV
jgi:tRNA threonylcarbamoyladenosine biosynthesis protein TsaB